MKSYDLVKMAGGNLVRHKLRTTLTVLGIVIGSISIILMIALGLGLQDTINNEFAGFSVEVIQVFKGNNVSNKSRLSEVQSFERLDDLDIEYFESIEGVDFASPTIQAYGKILSDQYEMTGNIVGIKPEHMDALGFDLAFGSYLDLKNPMGAVFGQGAIDGFEQAFSNDNQILRQVDDEDDGDEVQYGMFGLPVIDEDFDVDVLVDRMQVTLDTEYSVQSGNTLTTHDVYTMTGVGILDTGDATQDNLILMNFDTVKDMVDDYYRDFGMQLQDGYDSAYVVCEDMEEVKAINAEIQSKGYQTFAIADILDTIERTLAVMQVALGAIGGISLLVAAIGITNTMVMAITERKKEIGIMKVIGATLKDIKRLFLIEAAMIGAVGGVIGILTSLGISNLVSSPWFNNMLSGGAESSVSGPAFSFSIPTWLIIAGLGFTTAVGIISGYMPALKAMKSSALEALRNE